MHLNVYIYKSVVHIVSSIASFATDSDTFESKYSLSFLRMKTRHHMQREVYLSLSGKIRLSLRVKNATCFFFLGTKKLSTIVKILLEISKFLFRERFFWRSFSSGNKTWNLTPRRKLPKGNSSNQTVEEFLHTWHSCLFHSSLLLSKEKKTLCYINVDSSITFKEREIFAAKNDAIYITHSIKLGFLFVLLSLFWPKSPSRPSLS